MKNVIVTPQAPRAIGPYSQGIEANGFVFVSGQLPINPASGTIEATDITAQTDQVLKNVMAILAAAGCTADSVVKNTVFLSDISNFAAMNEVYKQYFKSDFPARSAFAVKDLPMGALVEVETIAAKG
jgi:2-iminobutanoate/2-iminopropanoate deaminase